MDNEGAAHTEDAAKQTRFEHDIVSGRILSGARRQGGRWAGGGRPIVPGERERGEVDFMRQLDETVQRAGPGSQGCGPGFDMRDVLEASGQRLQQLHLLSRRAEKDARFVHTFSHR